MRVRSLDRVITIEQPSYSVNTFGERTVSWSTYHECFAQVQRVSGMEKEEADKNTATRKVKFKIRFFDGIDETMRIVYNSDYYDIHEIQELDREGLWLTATKKL